MLHFIGVAGHAALPVASAAVVDAGRRLGGTGFGPVGLWHGGDCALAFRRRPLRDTDGHAADPVIGGDGSLVLLGSGRIDRQADVIGQLGLERTRVWTDAGLMMAAFSRWGEAAPERLHGDFSFIVWDRVRRRLTLARAGLGSLPLFYHRGDGFVVFGSTPAALIALGLFPRDLDHATVGEHLIGSAADNEASIYRAVRRVPRTAVTRIDPSDSGPSGARTAVYWRPRRGSVLRLKDDQAYVEAGREVLADVLCGYLRSTQPLAVMLSGGFDSGAIASTLALLAPGREILGLTTVPVPGSAAAGGAIGREWDLVQALARRYPNLRVQPVAEKTLTPVDEDARTLFDATGLPLTGISLMARRFALARAAERAGAATLLNGDGGNRTLTSEGNGLFRDLFLAGRWGRLARETVSAARYRRKPVMSFLWHVVLRDLVSRPVLRAWRRARGTLDVPIHDGSFLRPDFARASGLERLFAGVSHNPSRWKWMHQADLDTAALGISPSQAETFTLCFHGMGLDYGAPFRDRRMVDFVLSLPSDQLRRNGVPRFLARRVLADRLPPETLAERGYFPPFADAEDWVRGWWDKAAETLDSQHPVDLAAAAIDLPRLQARLAGGAPVFERPSGDDYDEIVQGMANALYVNAFLRWHAGRNQ